jgi:hypothetical protein
MEGQRIRNGLLFVIALCLVLIVLRLYSVDLVRPASAAENGTSSYMYACAGGTDCTHPDDWVPVRATNKGVLLVHQ